MADPRTRDPNTVNDGRLSLTVCHNVVTICGYLAVLCRSRLELCPDHTRPHARRGTSCMPPTFHAWANDGAPDAAKGNYPIGRRSNTAARERRSSGILHRFVSTQAVAHRDRIEAARSTHALAARLAAHLLDGALEFCGAGGGELRLLFSRGSLHGAAPSSAHACPPRGSPGLPRDAAGAACAVRGQRRCHRRRVAHRDAQPHRSSGTRRSRRSRSAPHRHHSSLRRLAGSWAARRWRSSSWSS